MNKFDVVIIGGGPAGCSCAYTCAKLGHKTLLVEKNNYLGGLMTGGLVIPVMKTDSQNINTAFFSELTSCAKKYGAQIEYSDGNKGWFNPDILKIVLDKMLKNAGVKILFESYPIEAQKNKNFVTGLKILSNILSLYVESCYFVDASGDSKIFQLLGEKFFEETARKQPSSLRFIMSGVQINRLKDFLISLDNNPDVTNFCNAGGQIHLTSAYTWDDKGWNLSPIFKKALENGDLTPFDTSYFQIFTVAGAPNSIAFNCPRLVDFNPNDPFSKSDALIEGRSAIYRISNFMKKYFAGFENAYISQIASMTGDRETNKIIAKNECKSETLFLGNKPLNTVLAGDYPIDIHSNDKNSSVLSKKGIYYLGVESLISKNYSNLFAAGRNLGADQKAQSALRTQMSCMSMGEGVAKYIDKLKSGKTLNESS